MISRLLANKITERLFKGKAIIILGARQVGKTTLIKQLFQNRDHLLWLNGDEIDVQNLFKDISSSRLRAIFGNKQIIVVDEAQQIKDIGIRLKLITDVLTEYQLIVTGSSSLELANHLNEPLTGRKWEFNMYPLTFREMVDEHGLLEEKRMIPHRLVYGYYPEVVTQQGDEELVLRQLSNSYLYKDILRLDQIKRPDALIKLLQAIAFQVGSQVSYSELSQMCGLDPKTVEKYIVVLEQSYIIFRLGSFSRNLRNELKFSKKIYFYDNGIRNVLISNFSQIENRTDLGALWENFVISERRKILQYNMKFPNSWFWRTKQQNEIDYLEEYNGELKAFEFKWKPEAKSKKQITFLNAYPETSINVIHKENIDLFLL